MRTALLGLLFLAALANEMSGAQKSEALSLDGEWDFGYLPAGAAGPAVYDGKISVPGWWDQQRGRLEKRSWFKDAAFVETQGTARFLSGVGWSRTFFEAPEAWRGRMITLTVGRAIGFADVFLNGRAVGHFEMGAYTPFEVDLTGVLEFGKRNELVVAVDNTKGDWGGLAISGNQGRASGISESVTIHVAAGGGRIADLFVMPGEDLREVRWQAEVHEGQLRNSKLRWEVLDARKERSIAKGETPVFGAKVEWRSRVKELKPWSEREPNLYWARLRWVDAGGRLIDEKEQRFGMKRLEIDGRKLLLNGEPIYLQGSMGHYHFPVHGSTPTEKAYWEGTIRKLKSLGFNYMNFCTQTAPRGLLEAADELGMIVQCGDHQTVLAEYAKDYQPVWTNIVRWTRGYPSMSIYGYGGERNYYEGIIEQYQRQTDLIKAMKPDALVMPQQAIRGIDYWFSDAEKAELTPLPFPHHAERLARYTKAADLFGHYSGPALSYRPDKKPTWKEVDERLRLYEKPLSAHELFIAGSWLNPKNARKWTGWVPPFMYEEAKERLEAQGLADKWRVYFENSSKLQNAGLRYNIEKVRKCHELAAFELLGFYDMHFIPFFTVGLLDEFMEPKPGFDAEGFRAINSENVLLIDYDKNESINRAFFEGEAFKADAYFSHYSAKDFGGGEFRWTLSRGGKVAAKGSKKVGALKSNAVHLLGDLELTWPEVKETTEFELAFELAGSAKVPKNKWRFWVFPRRDAPVVKAFADSESAKILGARYQLESNAGARLQIVTNLTAATIRHLNEGGDVLLLGAGPFGVNRHYNSFRSGIADNPAANYGTVVAKHPIFADLPNEGWADWHFYYILDGANPYLFDAEEMGGFDPILEHISPPQNVRKQASIFERRVGKGRLFATTAKFRMGNAACVALMDGILKYVSGEKFAPKLAMKLDETILADFTTAAIPRTDPNIVVDPAFETRSDYLVTWERFGKVAFDRSVAHTGRGSLRLDANPKGHSRVVTIPLFNSSSKGVRIAAWRKTQNLKLKEPVTISVTYNYFDGTRDTFRLPLGDGSDDWKLAEADFELKKELDPDQDPLLVIRLDATEGSIWLDDLYVGPPGGERKARQVY